MKKLLTLASLTFCLGFAANAQTDKAATIANDQNQVNVSTTSAEPVLSKADVTTTETPAKCEKACCSSKNKKGKESASAETKSCCSSGKKSASGCADKKAEVSPSQQEKSDSKSNTQ